MLDKDEVIDYLEGEKFYIRDRTPKTFNEFQYTEDYWTIDDWAAPGETILEAEKVQIYYDNLIEDCSEVNTIDELISLVSSLEDGQDPRQAVIDYLYELQIELDEAEREGRRNKIYYASVELLERIGQVLDDMKHWEMQKEKEKNGKT